MFIILVLVFVFAWIPSFFWLWVYRLQDREQPEPRSLIKKLFLAGICVTVPAVFFEAVFIPSKLYQIQTLLSILATVVITAVIEELLKFYTVKKITWHLKTFDQTIDGTIYSIAVALGFALVENFFYFLPLVFSNQLFSKFVLVFSYQEISGDFWTIFILIFASRFVFTTLMHTLSSGVMGIYLGKARFDTQNSSKLIIKGLIWAITFHALFNFFALINQVIFTFLITIVFAFSFFPYIRKKENIKIRMARENIFQN